MYVCMVYMCVWICVFVLVQACTRHDTHVGIRRQHGCLLPCLRRHFMLVLDYARLSDLWDWGNFPVPASRVSVGMWDHRCAALFRLTWVLEPELRFSSLSHPSTCLSSSLSRSPAEERFLQEHHCDSRWELTDATIECPFWLRPTHRNN